jgi:hypothetical protein
VKGADHHPPLQPGARGGLDHGGPGRLLAGGAGGGAQLGEDGGELVAGFLAQGGALVGGLAPEGGEFGAQLLDGGPVVAGAGPRRRPPAPVDLGPGGLGALGELAVPVGLDLAPVLFRGGLRGGDVLGGLLLRDPRTRSWRGRGCARLGRVARWGRAR